MLKEEIIQKLIDQVSDLRLISDVNETERKFAQLFLNGIIDKAQACRLKDACHTAKTFINSSNIKSPLITYSSEPVTPQEFHEHLKQKIINGTLIQSEIDELDKIFNCDFEQVLTIIKEGFAIDYSDDEQRGILKLIRVDFEKRVIIFEAKSFGANTIVIHSLSDVGKTIEKGGGT